MTPIGSTDDVPMSRARGRETGDPQREHLHDASTMAVPSTRACAIGGIQAASLLAHTLSPPGAERNPLDAIGERVGAIGWGIAALFLACRIASILRRRSRRAADASTRGPSSRRFISETKQLLRCFSAAFAKRPRLARWA